MAGSAALVCASMFYTLRQVLGRPDGEKPDGRFLHLWSHMVCGTEPRPEPLKGPTAAVYASCLRRDCAHRDIQNLLLHALGPYLHWSRLHFGLLPTLLINIAFAVVIRQQLFPSLNAGALVGMLIGSVVSSQLVLQQGVARVAAGQPEHALLRLAPGMPGSNALNRMLARGLLGLFFTNWLAAMSCSALLLAVADVPQAKFIEYMSSLSASALLAAGMLRNFALANKARGRIAMGILYVLTFSLMFLVMFLPGLLAPGTGVLAAPLFMLLMLLVWLIVWCCWRTMLSAPPAFPAARI